MKSNISIEAVNVNPINDLARREKELQDRLQQLTGNSDRGNK